MIFSNNFNWVSQTNVGFNPSIMSNTCAILYIWFYTICGYIQDRHFRRSVKHDSDNEYTKTMPSTRDLESEILRFWQCFHISISVRDLAVQMKKFKERIPGRSICTIIYLTISSIIFRVPSRISYRVEGMRCRWQNTVDDHSISLMTIR